MILESVTRRVRTGDYEMFDAVFSENGHTITKPIGFKPLWCEIDEKYAEANFKNMALEAWRDLQWMQGN